MAIAPIKITVKPESDAAEVQLSQGRSFLLAVVLGLLGALLNSYPIELAYNVSLVIGNLAFIIAAAYLRPTLSSLWFCYLWLRSTVCFLYAQSRMVFTDSRFFVLVNYWHATDGSNHLV